MPETFYSEKEWRNRIRISCARTNIGEMYYLMDETFDFIPLVKGYLDMLQSRAVDEVSPNTIRSYCNNLWHFIVFLKINNLDILDLDGKPEYLVKFKLWLKNPFRFYENVDIISEDAGFEDSDNKKLSNNTINQIIDRVSSLYLWLKAESRIKENPVRFVKVLAGKALNDKNPLSHIRRSNYVLKNALKSTKAIYTPPKTVALSDFKLFLDSLNLLRDKIMLLCLKEGGFRIGELLGIKLEDIDFANQSIKIVFRPDNPNHARAKAGYGRDREVNLPTDLMILIDRYISSEWINSDPKADFLFVVLKSKNPNDNGEPLDVSAVNSIFKYHSMKIFGYEIKNGKKVSLKHIHPHQLRHTHVSELVSEYIHNEQTINWKFISERIGHQSVTTTMNIYAHLTKEEYKKEYNKMQAYRDHTKTGGIYDKLKQNT